MLLSDLIGTWAMARVIGHSDGTQATAQGTATFTATKTGAVYDEAGTLQINASPPMAFERRYLWDTDQNVFFDDGRFFHTVPAQGGCADHHCAPDDYHVRYDFTDADHWQAVWRVTGPKKSYTMTTTYTRTITRR